MSLPRDLLRANTRRHFFEQCGVGLGKLALASTLIDDRSLGAAAAQVSNPLTPKEPHFPARAKSVIFLFMAGGPSQLDLFDYKPKLAELNGQPIPPSFMEGKRFAFMSSFTKEVPKLLGSRREFNRHGQSGRHVSELLPYTATVVDNLAFLSSVSTKNFNHAPAKILVNTGSTRFGHPSMGSGVTYGLGSESRDLPGFVVLQSGPRGPRGGALNWGSGFIPTSYQGVPFQSGGDPILNLSSPKGISPRRQAETIRAIRDLNLVRLAEMEDSEIATRISSYEMAYHMQTSGPELIDFRPKARRQWSSTAPSRARSPSPTIVCWRADWLSAACASFSSTTPIGTITVAARISRGTSKRSATRSISPAPP